MNPRRKVEDRLQRPMRVRVILRRPAFTSRSISYVNATIRATRSMFPRMTVGAAAVQALPALSSSQRVANAAFLRPTVLSPSLLDRGLEDDLALPVK